MREEGGGGRGGEGGKREGETEGCLRVSVNHGVCFVLRCLCTYCYVYTINLFQVNYLDSRAANLKGVVLLMLSGDVCSLACDVCILSCDSSRQ